ncbi:DUF3224 domain-containing protein [Natronoglycomyces albus]|uniref:DUF3224 domain-containing protein n=1 Tax=Natronoglycomyces albus TaxID=2811108 RepID=A0A895XIS8_9ACTN|nr:DUF3224 domain-containing protein [Natronoglycomyces albus]QSB04867.1 DUF3224 domain-containing protein [Natronoglycomyces albus]
MPQATGTYTFEKKSIPQVDLITVRVIQGDVNKVWKGDIEGKSSVLTVETVTQLPGSAGYVAVEVFDGTIDGHKGSFACLQRGIVNRDVETIDAVIVPDSGLDGLQNITGTFRITNDEGTMRYVLDYDFMEPHPDADVPVEEGK